MEAVPDNTVLKKFHLNNMCHESPSEFLIFQMYFWNYKSMHFKKMQKGKTKKERPTNNQFVDFYVKRMVGTWGLMTRLLVVETVEHI